MIFRSNPFYYFSFTKINQICSGIYNYLNSKRDSIAGQKYSEEEIELMTMKHYQEYINKFDFDKLFKNIFLDVVFFANRRLKYIYPKDKLEEKILDTILLFLAKPNRNEIFENKKRLITDLIKNTIEQHEPVVLYSSGKFSFLIVNLIHFFCYMLVYFLLSSTFLMFYNNLNKNQIEKLLLDKQKVANIDPDNINMYFSEKLKLLNGNLNPDSVLECCLPYIFDPIKNRIINN